MEKNAEKHVAKNQHHHIFTQPKRPILPIPYNRQNLTLLKNNKIFSKCG